MKKTDRHTVAVEAARLLDNGTLEERHTRYAQAYLSMVEYANYRPAAPGDGLGHTYLSLEEAHDPERLARETLKYVKEFDAEEDDGRFTIGCSNFNTNRALIWVIEAARSLCGGKDDLALELLDMALTEIKSESYMLNKKQAAE